MSSSCSTLTATITLRIMKVEKLLLLVPNRTRKKLPNRGLPLMGFLRRSIETLTSTVEEEGIGLRTEAFIVVLVNWGWCEFDWAADKKGRSQNEDYWKFYASMANFVFHLLCNFCSRAVGKLMKSTNLLVKVKKCYILPLNVVV